MSAPLDIDWVILTQGQRPASLDSAIESIGGPVTVVVNAPCATSSPRSDVTTVSAGRNLGVPEGRDLGVRSSSAGLVGFLDDDAVASPELTARVVAAFDADERLGAVALRLVDADGRTARRHVPRLGGRRADESGEVALFLGGACVIRREAYEAAGGYWDDLFYGHEELELSWRLVDRGWRIGYLADVTVFHPRTEISRHPDGWRLTGRNRVMIARRTLPWPVAVVHVHIWLALGLVRAPDSAGRRSYGAGWWSGWRVRIDRAPIRWRTVWRLTRLGRPPVL